MIAMKVKLNEEELKGEAITLTLKEPLPVENYGLENEQWYSNLENNNYMFIGLTDTLIIYISFDKEDYNAFVESLSNENGKELSIKIF